MKMSRPVSRAASSASAGAAAGVQGLQVHLRFDFFCISPQSCFCKPVIKILSVSHASLLHNFFSYLHKSYLLIGTVKT